MPGLCHDVVTLSGHNPEDFSASESTSSSRMTGGGYQPTHPCHKTSGCLWRTGRAAFPLRASTGPVGMTGLEPYAARLLVETDRVPSDTSPSGAEHLTPVRCHCTCCKGLRYRHLGHLYRRYRFLRKPHRFYLIWQQPLDVFGRQI